MANATREGAIMEMAEGRIASVSGLGSDRTNVVIEGDDGSITKAWAKTFVFIAMMQDVFLIPESRMDNYTGLRLQYMVGDDGRLVYISEPENGGE